MEKIGRKRSNGHANDGISKGILKISFFFVRSTGRLGIYWCAIGISFSPVPIAGSGASTVSTPSLLNEDLILSGLVPLGSRNSRLYSLYTDLLSVFSSCFAWTWNKKEWMKRFRIIIFYNRWWIRNNKFLSNSSLS